MLKEHFSRIFFCGVGGLSLKSMLCHEDTSIIIYSQGRMYYRPYNTNSIYYRDFQERKYPVSFSVEQVALYYQFYITNFV